MARVIFHLDMDAFFASIEQRDDPALRGRPVIVGGSPSRRGVVCAASYEARRFGVHSAMPSVTAGKLCPRGIFLPPRLDHYREESMRIMTLIRGPGILIEQVSIDEAYLDMTGVFSAGGDDAESLLYGAVALARDLKRRIRQERQLTGSIGIGSNKFLAKLASDFQKPDGLTLINDRDKAAFLRPLPVRVIHGVGKVTERTLRESGLETIGDLQDFPGDLRAIVGSWGPTLKQLAFGEDARAVEVGDEVKSISSEETFAQDTDDRGLLRECLRQQAGEIAAKLLRKHLAARTVQVKVRYGDFTTLTRQISLEDPVAEAGDIYRLACHLLARHKLVPRPLRLLGLGVAGLTERTVRQLPLPHLS